MYLAWQYSPPTAALAATPVLTELKPRGAEIGRPFTLTAVGRNLSEGARVTTTLPATFTLVVPAPQPGAMADAGPLRHLPGGAQRRCGAGRLPHPGRDAVGDLQHPAVHARHLSRSDGGRIAAQFAAESQRLHRDRRTRAILAGGGQRHAARSRARCLPRLRQGGRAARFRSGGAALRVGDRSGAAHSGRRGQAVGAQRRQSGHRPRYPPRFHLPHGRHLLRRSHRRALQ